MTHRQAHDACFFANSVRTQIAVEPRPSFNFEIRYLEVIFRKSKEVSTILADTSLAEGYRYLMLTCIGRDAVTEVAPNLH